MTSLLPKSSAPSRSASPKRSWSDSADSSTTSAIPVFRWTPSDLGVSVKNSPIQSFAIVPPPDWWSVVGALTSSPRLPPATSGVPSPPAETFSVSNLSAETFSVPNPPAENFSVLNPPAENFSVPNPPAENLGVPDPATAPASSALPFAPFITSGWPLSESLKGPIGGGASSSICIQGRPPAPSNDLFGCVKQLSNSLLFPFVSFSSVDELKSRGLLVDIPMRFIVNMPAVDLDKIEKTNLPETQITYQLLRAGYDIRLGERGRSSLKQEISKRTRILTDIKDTCFSTITRLKQANIYQLVQFSEICGILDRALEISQTYWRKYSRRQRAVRQSVSGAEEFFPMDVKFEETIKSESPDSSSRPPARRARRRRRHSEHEESSDSVPRKKVERPSRRYVNRDSLLSSLPISAELAQQRPPTESPGADVGPAAVCKQEEEGVATDDTATASFHQLERLLLQAALSTSYGPKTAMPTNEIIECWVDMIAERIDRASPTNATNKFETTLGEMLMGLQDSSEIRKSLNVAQEMLTRGLQATTMALDDVGRWSREKLDELERNRKTSNC